MLIGLELEQYGHVKPLELILELGSSLTKFVSKIMYLDRRNTSLPNNTNTDNELAASCASVNLKTIFNQLGAVFPTYSDENHKCLYRLRS